MKNGVVKTRLAKFAMVAMVLILGLFILQIFVALMPIHIEGTKTLNLISLIEMGLRVTAADNHKSVQELIGDDSTETNLNARVAHVLIDLGKLGFKTNQDGLICDAWGHPLGMIWATNAPFTNASKVVYDTNNPLFIWSFGGNGSNEFGAGDDIIYPR